MALVLADRVQQTGTANTTVSFNLLGFVDGFQSFAVIGDTNTTYYSAFDASGNWETGLGTYLTTGPILTRTTIYQSSNSNTAVTFSSAVNVFVTYPSGRSVNLDASGNATALGTPVSGNLANCTFPTLNQNTTGSAATFTSTTQNSQFNSLGVGTAGSTTAGEIRATNNVTAFYSSDRQFKENVQDIQSATEKVAAIGGKTFDWTDAYLKAHGGEDGYFYKKSDFGVIAQDVQTSFSQAVRTREDGTLAVDYPKLVALAFAAITELTKRIEVLESK
jgi:hypothetical protein